MVASITAIGSLIISALCFLWLLYVDGKSDDKELDTRIGDVETKLALMQQALDSLEAEQDEMKKTLKNLESGVHQLDLKIERILTILGTMK